MSRGVLSWSMSWVCWVFLGGLLAACWQSRGQSWGGGRAVSAQIPNVRALLELSRTVLGRSWAVSGRSSGHLGASCASEAQRGENGINRVTDFGFSGFSWGSSWDRGASWQLSGATLGYLTPAWRPKQNIWDHVEGIMDRLGIMMKSSRDALEGRQQPLRKSRAVRS
eukprot:8014005-Pyramimonas_sp.AAC.1